MLSLQALKTQVRRGVWLHREITTDDGIEVDAYFEVDEVNDYGRPESVALFKACVNGTASEVECDEDGVEAALLEAEQEDWDACHTADGHYRPSERDTDHDRDMGIV